MLAKILVIKFHDNDFHKSLRSLGEYLLDTVGLNVVQHILKEDNENEIFTEMFKHHLALYQHRFDMYIDYNSKANFLKKVNAYLTNDYFILKNIELKITYKDDYSDGETLVVDFYNNKVLVV